MEKLTLIKVGGKIVEEEETLRNLLNDFSQVEGYKVLVHGGGRSATKLAAQLGIESKMVGGRRITDADMLRVVTMVYGGLVNKNIVAGLQALGINALGLTGADMNLMRSDKRPVGEVDYGFVGNVKEVNADLLASLIYQDIVPVLAPLTHDKQGHMLNTNADTIAGEAAKALAKHFEVTLMFCFEKKGVLKDEYDDAYLITRLFRLPESKISLHTPLQLRLHDPLLRHEEIFVLLLLLGPRIGSVGSDHPVAGRPHEIDGGQKAVQLDLVRVDIAFLVLSRETQAHPLQPEAVEIIHKQVIRAFISRQGGVDHR